MMAEMYIPEAVILSVKIHRYEYKCELQTAKRNKLWIHLIQMTRQKEKILNSNHNDDNSNKMYDDSIVADKKWKLQAVHYQIHTDIYINTIIYIYIIHMLNPESSLQSSCNK